MLFRFLPVALLASTVLADGAAIVAAIEKITNDTLALQSSVAGWDGDLLGTLPIIAASGELLADIDSGTKVAKHSANLTFAEILDVAGVTTTLVGDVQSSLATIIGARQKFIRILLAPVIKIDLELTQSATDKFSAAVISKIAAPFNTLAEQIIAPIDVAFKEAIGNYTNVL